MLVRVVLKAGGSGASCGDRRSGACFARISGVARFGGSCGVLVWAVFKGLRSGARRGDKGGRERAREERAVVLADLKCASFRRSPGVLVLEDISGASFGGSSNGRGVDFVVWEWLVLADLEGCSFWRILRSARLGSFQRRSLWRTSRGQRGMGRERGKNGPSF